MVITGSFDPVGVEENVGFGLPKVFLLSQNYPNPFHTSTIIRYAIPVAIGNETLDPILVHLVVYDIMGRLVEILVDEVHKPGVYQVEWDGRIAESGVRNGIYFYRLQAGDFTDTKKLILLR